MAQVFQCLGYYTPLVSPRALHSFSEIFLSQNHFSSTKMVFTGIFRSLTEYYRYKRATRRSRKPGKRALQALPIVRPLTEPRTTTARPVSEIPSYYSLQVVSRTPRGAFTGAELLSDNRSLVDPLTSAVSYQAPDRFTDQAPEAESLVVSQSSLHDNSSEFSFDQSLRREQSSESARQGEAYGNELALLARAGAFARQRRTGDQNNELFLDPSSPSTRPVRSVPSVASRNSSLEHLGDIKSRPSKPRARGSELFIEPPSPLQTHARSYEHIVPLERTVSDKIRGKLRQLQSKYQLSRPTTTRAESPILKIRSGLLPQKASGTPVVFQPPFLDVEIPTFKLDIPEFSSI